MHDIEYLLNISSINDVALREDSTELSKSSGLSTNMARDLLVHSKSPSCVFRNQHDSRTGGAVNRVPGEVAA